MHTNRYTDLQAAIGYTFKNLALLEEALTHPSYSNKKGAKNNQRLEFLGDSVLGLILADLVFHAFPQEREGKLTQIKGILEHRHFLAEIAQKLGLPQYLILNSSEYLLGTAHNTSVLEDALEALIGAIYLDSDWPQTQRTILHWYGDITTYIHQHSHKHNPKGQLQEYFQSKKEKVTPLYEIVESQGPDHAKIYTAIVKVRNQQLALGTGKSKKEAEENAASKALDTLPPLP